LPAAISAAGTSNRRAAISLDRSAHSRGDGFDLKVIFDAPYCAIDESQSADNAQLRADSCAIDLIVVAR
jgi:hypothetical protein